jgi:hypothetical protein
MDKSALIQNVIPTPPRKQKAHEMGSQQNGCEMNSILSFS